MKKALIVIDLQNDFCEGGPLSTNRSLEIIPIINRIRSKFDLIIFTKEWHPFNHCSFKEFKGNYPANCVEHTRGAELHQELTIKEDDIIIIKGTLQMYESYSAFYNAKTINKQTKLEQVLKNKQISEIYICGIGLTDCIFSTILDALKFKYQIKFISDATAYSENEKTKKCLDFIKNLGVKIISSNDL